MPISVIPRGMITDSRLLPGGPGFLVLEQYFGTNTNAGVLCLEDFPDHIDWYNQQGGNKNGIFIELRNVSRVRVAFSVRLSYESGRLCPLQTQDGKPLLELQFTNGGEALEPNQQMQARCRINELTSQHQKQRFLIEIIALGGALVLARNDVTCVVNISEYCTQILAV